ncbi:MULTISPECIES: hypothetical protein [unclassified Rathayibacter]|uniref:hypothetical protein n=1 Tax=unclassified Rathayibacter TaxID=2609250 RepID=UPI001FB43B4B|nr:MULTISPECIES: hypothetical protein [unclassified Rathayibacter]MCJ1673048.1 hypothetical protein [Rathayibacter sp. VKM Ac-2929]MCJ1682544.1 hypothetical protein [Rathayibacter sp. VKM Ac-2928]
MTPHTSPRPRASGLVALVATGALLLTGTPALAETAHSAVSAKASPVVTDPPIDPHESADDTLDAGDELLPGDFLASDSATGGHTFRMQDDGNAVVYDAVGHALFNTGTTGRGSRLVLQDDGNVVIYSDQDRPLWNTGTDNEPDSHLVIQGDGNLVLYREDDTPAWASSVNRTIPEPPFSSLSDGDELHRGHQLTSKNGLFRAVMQRDGNFVGYGPDGALWSTGTRGSDNTFVVDEGFATIIDADEQVKWISLPEGSGDVDTVTLGDNGVLSMDNEADAVVWSSQSELPGPSMYAPNTLKTDEILRSESLQYRVVMQADGNVVVYGPQGAVWQTATSGAGSSLEFTKDGALQVVTADGSVTWTAKPSGGTGPFRLVMQSDGNLVEYDGQGRAVWSSR